MYNFSKIVWCNGTIPVDSAFAAPGYDYGIVVAGGNGTGNAANQLHTAGGMVVDNNGDIYVADVLNNRVQKWAPWAASGVTVAGGNGNGSAANQFDGPIAIAMDQNKNLYVLDQLNFRVQKWTAGATRGVTVAGGNGRGAGASQIDLSISLAIDKSGNLYIGDIKNNRVQKWAPGAASGVTVAGGNGGGTAPNQLFGPYGFAFDATGNLFISDEGNFRVQKWAPGATSGTTVAGGNGLGTALNQIFGPAGVYVDANDTVYVSDLQNQRVTKWAPGGSTGILVVGGNGIGLGLNQFNQPWAIYIDANGNLYVVDSFNDRVLEFPPHPVNPEYTPTVPGTYTAVVSNSFGCSVTTNPVTVSAVASLGVNVYARPDTSCSGTDIHFFATVPNDGSSHSYQWMVNSQPAGTDSTGFISNSLNDKDTVTCILSSSNTCVTSSSDKVIVTVLPSPVIQPAEAISIFLGQHTVLTPVLYGNISSFIWQPGKSLSDSTVSNPVASPSRTTLYHLKAIATDGCEVTGTFLVEVSSDALIPNAFTPNNDGRNDIFYVLCAQAGSRIESMEIFNRWGQAVFLSRNLLPGDASRGWNGYYNGSPAPSGSYIYRIQIVLPDGTKKIYRGTIILVR